MAAKGRAIQRVFVCRIEHGYQRIFTAGDSRNAAALALNEKLGFRRQVGWVTLEKALCA